MGIRRNSVKWNEISDQGYQAAKAGLSVDDNPEKGYNNTNLAWLSGHMRFYHEMLCEWSRTDRSVNYDDWLKVKMKG